MTKLESMKALERTAADLRNRANDAERSAKDVRRELADEVREAIAEVAALMKVDELSTDIVDTRRQRQFVYDAQQRLAMQHQESVRRIGIDMTAYPARTKNAYQQVHLSMLSDAEAGSPWTHHQERLDAARAAVFFEAGYLHGLEAFAGELRRLAFEAGAKNKSSVLRPAKASKLPSILKAAIDNAVEVAGNVTVPDFDPSDSVEEQALASGIEQAKNRAHHAATRVKSDSGQFWTRWMDSPSRQLSEFAQRAEQAVAVIGREAMAVSSSLSMLKLLNAELSRGQQHIRFANRSMDLHGESLEAWLTVLEDERFQPLLFEIGGVAEAPTDYIGRVDLISAVVDFERSALARNASQVTPEAVSPGLSIV